MSEPSDPLASQICLTSLGQILMIALTFSGTIVRWWIMCWIGSACPASVASRGWRKPGVRQVRPPALRGYLVPYTSHLLLATMWSSSTLEQVLEQCSWYMKDLKPPQHRGDSQRWKWRAPIMVLTWLVSLSSSQFFRFPSCGSCPIFQHGHGIRRHPETPKASVQL